MAHISPFCFLFSLRRERGRVVCEIHTYRVQAEFNLNGQVGIPDFVMV